MAMHQASKQWMAMVMEPLHGNAASEQRMVMESSHTDTSFQQILSLMGTSEAACAYSNKQMFSGRVKVNC
jgi:hypothetical protein